LRVLHIITGLAAGGAEQQLRLLVRNQRGVAEVAALTNMGSVAQAIMADGTPVHDIRMRGNTDVAALPRLVGIIRAGSFDVVHTHLYRACVYGRVAARLAGVRHVVATEHSLGDGVIEGRPTSRGIRALYLAAERLGDATIAVSTTVARRLVAWGIPRRRVDVIPNGLEVDDYRYDPADRARLRAGLGIAGDRFVVGTVGRLVPGKGTDVALRAIRDQPGATTLVVGDGPQRPALTRLANALGVDAVFTGESADVPRLLSAMDVLLAPSRQETFNLAVIEALAAGLPVLYSSCPALDDLPSASVPWARRLPADSDAFGPAVAAEARIGPRRLPPPAALDAYAAAHVVARIEALYAKLLGAAARRGEERVSRSRT